MAKQSAKARDVYRIQLTPEAKEQLEKISDQLGTTQLSLTSKIVEWFAHQPQSIQAVILGLYPEVIRKEVAHLLLERAKGGVHKL
ncbi:MAG TPA: hypothetical protein VGB55_10565 [Tepidisphaeraceae bacterium]|jgi:predicted nucleic acid-binding OB-fold protein